LLFILVDTRANRIVDYVNIDNWEQTVDINAKLTEGSAQLGGNPADYKNPPTNGLPIAWQLHFAQRADPLV
jgi:hypothetical protein